MTTLKTWQCPCGEVHTYSSAFTIECACGRFFNGSGQALQHPRYWGEETGERFDDHGNYISGGEDYEPELDELDFADPGGGSALRAATRTNPRNLPCPNCGQPNRLTPKDRALGYQCDECADRLERGGY